MIDLLGERLESRVRAACFEVDLTFSINCMRQRTSYNETVENKLIRGYIESELDRHQSVHGNQHGYLCYFKPCDWSYHFNGDFRHWSARTFASISLCNCLDNLRIG